MNYLSKYLIEEAAAISSCAKNLDEGEVNRALELLDNCSAYNLKLIILITLLSGGKTKHKEDGSLLEQMVD